MAVLFETYMRRRWEVQKDAAATLPQRLVAGWDDVNNIYEWAMSQKLPVHCFKKVKETTQFNEDST